MRGLTVTQQYVIHIAREAIYHTFLASAPMLGFASIIGLAIGIFQAVTSIHEMTLTFIPKILAVVAALVVFLPWMLRTLLSLTIRLYNLVPALGQ